MTKGWLNDDFDVPGTITGGGIQSTPIGTTTTAASEFTTTIIGDGTASGQALTTPLSVISAVADRNIALFESNVDSTQQGPNVYLYRNSATPAASDAIGIIHYEGEDSAGNAQTYAQAGSTILDPTSTSEEGSYFINTTVAGSSTKVLDCRGIGNTQPLQPWVIATGTSSSNQTGDGTQYNQVFNTEIKDVGGNFASSTFTAPITGCYQQSYNVIYEGLSSSNTYCRGRIVTSNRTYEDYLILLTAQASFNTNRVVHAMDMDAADTAVCNVVVLGSTKVVDINGAKYSCYLLG